MIVHADNRMTDGPAAAAAATAERSGDDSLSERARTTSASKERDEQMDLDDASSSGHDSLLSLAADASLQRLQHLH
jgi:hypothetical protein